MAKTEKASTRLQYGQRPSVPGMYLAPFHGRIRRRCEPTTARSSQAGHSWPGRKRMEFATS